MIKEKNFVSNFNLTLKQKNQFLDIRKRIDDIDHIIIELLIKRTSIIEEARELKTQFYDPKKCFITSGREANMVKALANKIKGPFPKEAIVNLWRNIISVSVGVEVPLNLAIYKTTKNYDCYLNAICYFGTHLKMEFNNNISRILERIISGNNTIGVIPTISKSKFPWWYLLYKYYPSLKVFGYLPFIENKLFKDHTKSIIIANIIPEQTIEDKTYIVAEFQSFVKNGEIRKELTQKQFNFQEISSIEIEEKLYILYEVEGYIHVNNPDKIKIEGANIEVIGSYSVPILI